MEARLKAEEDKRMNEELTNEVLEAMTKCDETLCGKCLAEGVCCLEGDIPIEQKLAGALLEERAKPKVWDGAPEWAKVALVGWYENNEQKQTLCCKCYTRELPKTRIDEIADEVWHEINKGVTGLPNDIIKRGLKKYAEELKGEA